MGWVTTKDTDEVEIGVLHRLIVEIGSPFPSTGIQSSIRRLIGAADFFNSRVSVDLDGITFEKAEGPQEPGGRWPPWRMVIPYRRVAE